MVGGEATGPGARKAGTRAVSVGWMLVMELVVTGSRVGWSEASRAARDRLQPGATRRQKARSDKHLNAVRTVRELG